MTIEEIIVLLNDCKRVVRTGQYTLDLYWYIDKRLVANGSFQVYKEYSPYVNPNHITPGYVIFDYMEQYKIIRHPDATKLFHCGL